MSMTSMSQNKKCAVPRIVMGRRYLCHVLCLGTQRYGNRSGFGDGQSGLGNTMRSLILGPPPKPASPLRAHP